MLVRYGWLFLVVVVGLTVGCLGVGNDVPQTEAEQRLEALLAAASEDELEAFFDDDSEISASVAALLNGAELEIYDELDWTPPPFLPSPAPQMAAEEEHNSFQEWLWYSALMDFSWALRQIDVTEAPELEELFFALSSAFWMVWEEEVDWDALEEDGWAQLADWFELEQMGGEGEEAWATWRSRSFDADEEDLDEYSSASIVLEFTLTVQWVEKDGDWIVDSLVFGWLLDITAAEQNG